MIDIKVEIKEKAELYPRSFLKYCSSFNFCIDNRVWPSLYTLNSFLAKGYDESIDEKEVTWNPLSFDAQEYDSARRSIVIEELFEFDLREIEWSIFHEEIKAKYLK